MPSSKSSDSSRVLFRLTPEASKRIEERIKNGTLKILQELNININNLDRTDRLVEIAERAKVILQKKGKSTTGCSDYTSVDRWLKRGQKEFSVFIVLCEVTDENWLNAFERNDAFQAIMTQERRKSFITLIDSLSNTFIDFGEGANYIVSKHIDSVRDIIGSDELEEEKIKELVKLLLNDFAMNGRQIRLKLENLQEECQISLIKITGENQNNKLETWTSNDISSKEHIIEVANWWWKGKIDIQLHALLDGREKVHFSGEVFISEKGYVWADIIFDFKKGIFL
jgi:hypothetical protein